MRILDSKYFTGIKFCVLFWAQLNLYCSFPRKQIFAVLEKIAEISNIRLPAKICNTKVTFFFLNTKTMFIQKLCIQNNFPIHFNENTINELHYTAGYTHSTLSKSLMFGSSK